MKSTLIAAALAACGPLALAETPPASTAPATWPQWRGPTRDGQCGPSRSWPAALDEGRLRRTWRLERLGPSYSGPIVAEDRVFTTETRDEKVEVVRAVDRRTGREIWSASWDGAMKVPFFAARNGSWIRSTPAWDGQRLYVGGMRDVLVCLDGSDGTRLWSVDFPTDHGTPLPSFGFVCSPLVDGESVYAQVGGALVKVDKRSGAVQWRTLEGGAAMNSAFSSPILATLAGRRQLVVQSRTKLCGVEPGSGVVIWERPIKSFRGMNILTPTVVGDAVFTAPYGGRAQLLDLTRDEESLLVEQRWDRGLQGYMTSPVVIGDDVYFFTRSNRFACLGLADGAERWISGPTGDTYWSLVAAGDRILALGDSGMLRLIRATPDEFVVIDERQVAEDATWAHLAVAGDEIFIREQGALAGYRWREPEAAPGR